MHQKRFFLSLKVSNILLHEQFASISIYRMKSNLSLLFLFNGMNFFVCLNFMTFFFPFVPSLVCGAQCIWAGLFDPNLLCQNICNYECSPHTYVYRYICVQCSCKIIMVSCFMCMVCIVMWALGQSGASSNITNFIYTYRNKGLKDGKNVTVEIAFRTPAVHK